MCLLRAPCTQPLPEGTPTCESVLDSIGWGHYHNGVLIILGLSTFAEAISVISAPFAVQLASCDFVISEEELTVVNAVESFGTGVGSFLCGFMSDRVGQKYMVPITMILAFIGTIGTGFATSAHLVIVFIFVMGMGIGGNTIVVRTYAAEMMTTNKRGAGVTILDLWWTAGYIFTVGVGWLLLPYMLRSSAEELRLSSWRVMFAMGGVVGIFVACTTGLISHSPRYLLRMRRLPEAEEFFKQMFAINTGRLVADYNMRNLDGRVEPIKEEELYMSLLQPSDACGLFWNKLKEMFSKKYRYQLIIPILVSMVLFAGSGLITLYASNLLYWNNGKLFGKPCRIGTVDILEMDTKHGECYFKVLESPHKPILVLSTAMFVGRLILYFIIDRAGRRNILVVSLMAAAMFAGLMTGTGKEDFPLEARYATRYLLVLFYTVAESVFLVMMLDSFPTAIRGTTVGMLRLISRLVTLVIELCLVTSCEMATGVFSGMMAVAAILSCLLPDLTGLPMVE